MDMEDDSLRTPETQNSKAFSSQRSELVAVLEDKYTLHTKSQLKELTNEEGTILAMKKSKSVQF